MMIENGITAENLTFTYPDGHRAIEDFNLVVEPGESVALIGANGAGKSTLFNLMVGIHLPTQGSLAVAGHPVLKKNLKALRRQVGLVFQNPDDQLFSTTVYDDVAFGPRNMGYSAQDTEAAVIQALDSLGIAALKDRFSARLSIGEKRMVAVATTLSTAPQILLFDEPSSFLDPQARRNLIKTLGGLKQTKIIATHDLDFAAELCTRVLVMKQGRLYAQGPAHKILKDEALLSACHLEMPLGYLRCKSCTHHYSPTC